MPDMKYLPLLWAGLWRKPVRTVLTVLSIAVAFVLFGTLHGVTTGFDVVLAKFSETRLCVMNRANLTELLPVSYAAQIARVPGVRAVTPIVIFVGYYQDPKNNIDGNALEVDTYLDMVPRVAVSADQRDAMRRTRTGALVGAELAKRFNWKTGDRITLHSVLWSNKDGTMDWPLDIVGIHNGNPGDEPLYANAVFFNYDYLDAARAYGSGTVHQFVVSIDDPARGSEIAIAIDRLFANSGAETTTLNERAWAASLIRDVGDVQFFVDSIIGAVLFTLLFLAGNTMSQSVRDRLGEFGVLKALGFTDTAVWWLVVAESIVLTVTAAGMGLAVASATLPKVFQSSGMGPIPLPRVVYVVGFGISVLLALISATIPAARARALTISETLSGR
jgi:putative ABC transport system permease protein